MIHLEITQTKNTAEVVPMSFINKLYELAYENASLHITSQLDATSNIIGKILSLGGYRNQVMYLGNVLNATRGNDDPAQPKFPNLDIDLGNPPAFYIQFADPVIALIMTNKFGDSIGVTETAAALANNTGLTLIKSLTKGNTNITSFDEFGYFTNCTTIPSEMFKGCTNLTSIDLSNVTNIGTYAFNASGLTGDLSIPNLQSLSGSATDISYAFSSCSNITSVSNLGQVSLIPRSAFDNCASLVSVVLPSECKTIGMNAFYHDAALTTMDLSGITAMYSGAFQGCTSFHPTISDFQSLIQTYGSRDTGVFSGKSESTCTWNITDLTLPNFTKVSHRFGESQPSLRTINLTSVQEIGCWGTFQDCTNLTSATISNSGNPINIVYDHQYSGNGIFQGCTSLTTVYLSGLTTLTPNIFNGCSSLTTINEDFIENVTSIRGSNQFSGCVGLNNKVLNFKNALTIGEPHTTATSSGSICTRPFKECGFNYVYFPKVTRIYTVLKSRYNNSGSDQVGSFSSLETENLSSNKGNNFSFLYLRDITMLPAGMFINTAITTLVINNSTPPTLATTVEDLCGNANPTNGNANDMKNSLSYLLGVYPDLTTDLFWGVKNVSSIKLYVPDAAVPTYKANSLFASLDSNNILPISSLTQVTRAQFDAAPGVDKIISEYM